MIKASRILMSLVLAFAVSFTAWADDSPKKKELKLITAKQLSGKLGKRFDLSGLAMYKGALVAVADKDDNRFVYRLIDEGETFQVHPWIALKYKGRLDLEGIETSGSHIYLINEKTSEVLRASVDGDVKKVAVNYPSADIDVSSWGNAGLEGLAVSPDGKTLYLAKERQPRYILKVVAGTGKIVGKFNMGKGHDFTGLTMDNSGRYLYALVRSGWRVIKYDLEQRKIVDEYSFEKSAVTDRRKMYEPYEYGMAEALVVTDDRILIGFDNNGTKVSKQAKKRYGFRGNAPSVLVFERPEGF
ncbi:hypothetical protein FUAX_12370 [Fulvitalea axinellae]|uniref:Uncharacterized protein n=1 Tax=Fulvitalea axinellae TaxID=1182444 RepID=A0AAU9D949_9BACT|nr:hypothetical protein FUAX_12370 [Fulvitalea axinellae]